MQFGAQCAVESEKRITSSPHVCHDLPSQQSMVCHGIANNPHQQHKSWHDDDDDDGDDDVVAVSPELNIQQLL